MTITRDDLVEAIIAEGLELEAPPLKLEQLAENVADRFRLECEVPDIPPSVKVYDLREEQDYVYPRGKRKARINPRTGKAVERDPKDVTHIVVHQTAVEFGLSKRQIRASGGDEELALARRFLDVACHAAATRRGFCVLTHPLRDLIWHGNGYNDFSLGLEIDGKYAGLEDDPSTVAREDLRTTWQGDPTKLTDKTIEAARGALRQLVTQGRALGMPLTHIVAHRQSSGSRRSDPGEAIWQHVVLWAEKELSLEVDLDHTLVSQRSGPGRPIPKQWDARSDARY